MKNIPIKRVGEFCAHILEAVKGGSYDSLQVTFTKDKKGEIHDLKAPFKPMANHAKI